MAQHQPHRRRLSELLVQELCFAAVFVPVSLAPVALMSVLLGLDPSDPRERNAVLVGALSSLIAFFLVYRLYQRRMLESSLRVALAEQARTDMLTGLGNRRRLYEDLDREISRCRRDQVPISLLLIDLDDFKPINDRYGHATGDDILVALARCAEQLIRSGVDGAYRMGGDEFTVALPGADRDQAATVARRLRQAFRSAAGPIGQPLRVDCSIGVASRRPALDDEAVDAWLGRADQAMYVAKRQGGGVALASDPPLARLSEEDVSMICRSPLSLAPSGEFPVLRDRTTLPN